MPDFSPVLRLIGPLGDAEVTDGRSSRGWWVVAFRDAAGKRRLLVQDVLMTAAKAVKARRRAEKVARRAVGEVASVR